MFGWDKDDDSNDAFTAFLIDKLNQETKGDGLYGSQDNDSGDEYDGSYSDIPDYSDSGDDY